MFHFKKKLIYLEWEKYNFKIETCLNSIIIYLIKMNKKIIFIGGIHGVGKGSVCNILSEQFKLEHFSASQLLKWSELSPDTNKKVQNIDYTQVRLLRGINQHIPEDKLSILDGHLCLLNKFGVPEKVDEKIIIKINPLLIGIVTENVELIKERLDKRDSVRYDIEMLKEMQTLELSQAIKIANQLNIDFLKIDQGNILKISQKIKTLI